MFTKHTALFSMLTLATLVGCSTPIIKPAKNTVAEHDGKIYQTKNLILEVTPTPEGFKIYPTKAPLKDMKVKDAYYSFVVEKENHSLNLVKKKDFYLVEGNFVHDKVYRIHLTVKHDGLNEDITFEQKF